MAQVAILEEPADEVEFAEELPVEDILLDDPAQDPIQDSMREALPAGIPAAGESVQESAGGLTEEATSADTGPAPRVASDSPSFRNGQPAARIKDLARLAGVRDNQLVGLGLVVGLDGTGDGRGTQANVQMVANMLARFGIGVDQDALRLRNVAAVVVTAELPPFQRPGDRIDVVVSSFGDARSLQGGYLLQTPLQGGDGQVYAVAQGPVSIGGFNVRAGGAQTQRNHAVVGRIPNGAIVEREVPFYLDDSRLTWLLNEPDFTTAARVAAVINEHFPEARATAQDGGAVVVQVPEIFQGRLVDFIAAVEGLPVVPDAPARVVINERTGTVVIGHQVRIAAAAVAHGNLTVRITSEVSVSQPPPFSRGQTVVSQQERIEVEEGTGQVTLLDGGATVEQVVKALNAIGVSPRDLIAIFQALKAAGALYAELEII